MKTDHLESSECSNALASSECLDALESLEYPESLFLELLRIGLWNKPLTGFPHLEKSEWNDSFQLAVKQSVWPIVADLINRLPADRQPPAQVSQQLNYLLSRNRNKHARLNNTLVQAVDLLRSNHIEPILLKGQGVAIYYPDPTLRCCGDIDLYIGADQYDLSCSLAKKWGEDGESIVSKKHYHFNHNGVSIELHRIAGSLSGNLRDKRFQQWIHRMLIPENCRKIEFDGTTILVPPADFEILYIFHHAYHHFLLGGVGLRQFCDWTLALHHFRETIDHKALEQNLKSFGLFTGWKVFGGIAVDHLGLPDVYFPFYDPSYRSKSRKALNIIFTEGNFGRHNPAKSSRPNTYFAGKWHSFKITYQRFYKLFPLFPREVLKVYLKFIFVGVKAVINDQFFKRKKRRA